MQLRFFEPTLFMYSGIQGLIWVLISPVPGLCILFTFTFVHFMGMYCAK